ncbi:MAG: hypothetical protein HFF80_11025, partial [Oscillospiraceae bacterium]|nr:hypothetical protein [Oscillospiraceae bacterium]
MTLTGVCSDSWSVFAGSTEVRAVAMSSTDGLRRGMPVRDTGRPIEVPVGQCV